MSDLEPVNRGIEIKDETLNNYLVMHPSGRAETIPKTPKNVLVLEHNLRRVLVDEEEILFLGDDNSIHIIPQGDNRFILHIGNQDLFIEPDRKTELLSKIIEYYDSNEDESVFHDYYREIKDKRVNEELVLEILDEGFDFLIEDGTLSIEDIGIKIRDSIYLKWDNDFWIEKTPVSRGGKVMNQENSNKALRLTMSEYHEEFTGTVQVDGKTTPVTEEDVTFFTNLMWAIRHI